MGILMYRIACLRIPRFQIVVHQKQEPELKKRPLALIASRNTTAFSDLNTTSKPINISRAKVYMCSSEAAKANIYPGMRMTEARAECADLMWRECNDKLYKQAETALLNELIACSPRVSIQQAGIFLLDASGLQRLGGESKLCREILKCASRCGYVEGQVGVADSAFAALVATRSKTKRWLIVPQNRDQEFLSPLPITYLPISAAVRELLDELGIRTMGEIAKLPGAELLERFGAEGKLIHELVHGIDDNQPRLPPIEKKFETSIELGGPIESLNQTLFLFKAMLDRLSIELKNQMLCADELLVGFYNDSDKFDERRIQLIKPSNTAKFLVDVIRLTLESKPLQREFTGLNVAITSFCNEGWSQPQIEISAGTMNATGEKDPMQTENAMLLLQRFRARVGENALVCAAPSDEYFCEKAGVWIPVLKPKSDSAGTFQALSDDEQCTSAAPHTVQPITMSTNYVLQHTNAQSLTNGFVKRKLSPPERILVRLDQQSQPIAVTYKDHWYKVLKITAPECLSGHWWDNPIRKSYYTALIESTRSPTTMLVSLIFDAEANNWLIDAVFD
jgi:nucleotidyltransferase/DNA polymerase involved in DNA repair